jgi:ADP-ribose pyrophosphatase YjhB (NUDIX family)
MKKIVCSGALFYALSSNRFLFLHRARSKHSDTWGLVGGVNEENETPWNALEREIYEEISNTEIKKAIPLETYISNDNGFVFHTYLCLVQDEFMPILNEEHDGYAWVSHKKWPRPLHQGLKNTLSNRINQAKLDTVINLIQLIN